MHIVQAHIAQNALARVATNPLYRIIKHTYLAPQVYAAMTVKIRKNSSSSRRPRWDVIKLSDVNIDDRTQPRAELDQATVKEYMERMQKPSKDQPVEDLEGRPFEPIKVFRDNNKLWLADGFHRLEAARRLKIKNFQADIEDGDLRDAIRYSLSANSRHGLRRTNADKRRAVARALMDPEWIKLSDNKLAVMCAVSRPFVSKVRSTLEDDGEIKSQNVRLDAQGNEYHIDKVGARAYLKQQKEERKKKVKKELSKPLPTATPAKALATAAAAPAKKTVKVKITPSKPTKAAGATSQAAPRFSPKLEVISFAGLEHFEGTAGVIVAHPDSIEDWIILGRQLRQRLDMGGFLVLQAPTGSRAFTGAIQLHASIKRSDVYGPSYVVVGEELVVYAVWTRGQNDITHIAASPEDLLQQLGDEDTRYLVVGTPPE